MQMAGMLWVVMVCILLLYIVYLFVFQFCKWIFCSLFLSQFLWFCSLWQMFVWHHTIKCMYILYLSCSFSRHYSSLEVASEYFRSGADKISVGSDAVYAAEGYIKTGVCSNFDHLFPWQFWGWCDSAISTMVLSILIILLLFYFQVKTGKSSLEQISRVYGNQVILIIDLCMTLPLIDVCDLILE